MKRSSNNSVDIVINAQQITVSQNQNMKGRRNTSTILNYAH